MSEGPASSYLSRIKEGERETFSESLPQLHAAASKATGNSQM